MKTILITAIGSMSAEYVIRQFSKSNKVVGCDIYPLHWHFESKLCNKTYQVPLATDDNYIKVLLEICRNEDIDFIVPLTDLEIDILNQNRLLFAKNKVTLCMPSEKTLKIARDKLALYNFFKDDAKVSVIKTVDKIQKTDEISFPMIAKPYNGRSSQGLFTIQNQKDLAYILNKEGYIFQEYKKGNVFTVDCVRNANTGEIVAIGREELLRTKNGAGLTVKIIDDKTLIKKVHYIAEKLEANGCINVEFIKHSGEYYLIDINPRFSAGVAFSAMAGYDMVSNHLRCFTEQNIDSFIQAEEKILTKKFQEIII